MIGDVVGRGGRTTVKNILPDLINEYQIDFVTLQGENMASGFGLTLETVMDKAGKFGRTLGKFKLKMKMTNGFIYMKL